MNKISGAECIKLANLSIGTPLKVKLSPMLKWKQVILVGIDTNNGVFTFADTSGLFKLRYNYIASNNISFSLNDNDPIEIMRIRQIVGF